MQNNSSHEAGLGKRIFKVAGFLFNILSYLIRCLFGLLIMSFWAIGACLILVFGTSLSATSGGRKLARPFVVISEQFLVIEMGEDALGDLIGSIFGIVLAYGMLALYSRFILPLGKGNIPKMIIFWFLTFIGFLYFLAIGYSYQISFF